MPIAQAAAQQPAVEAFSAPAASSSTDRSTRKRVSLVPFSSITQAAPRPSADASVPSAAPTTSSSSSSPSSAPADKPAHDVVAGAMARAASQSTIHPLDTMKVRMQAGKAPPKDSKPGTLAGGGPGAGNRTFRVNAAGVHMQGDALQRGLREVASLYKGVVSAATGAGIIIGAYFAFYSTTKRFLRENTKMHDGSIAFVSGATAAVGSSVVKVPIAVCIRSVQAGVYPNVVLAAKSIVRAAGVGGLFTGFVPTLLEDAPDMAVKFAVYETMRAVHKQLHGGRDPSTLEDLLMGGSAGAAAAAATTPLDVVKTRMMCSASSRPTLSAAVRGVLAEGGGLRDFFRGVGPRALSNGLNSAIFFCFFEAIRRVLVAQQQEKLVQQALLLESDQRQREQQQQSSGGGGGGPVAAASISSHLLASQQRWLQRSSGGRSDQGSSSSRMACLSLAVPLHACHRVR